MRLRAIFAVFSLCCFSIVLLYLMSFNKASKLPWRPSLQFEATTSNNMGEHSSSQSVEEKNGSTQQPQTFVQRTNLILLSPGRGGSSFLGEIFNSNPQVMYWFEPLHTVICNLFDVQLFIEGKEPKEYKETAIKVINSFFQCEFSDINNSTLSSFARSPFRSRSKALTSGYLCRNKCAPFSNTQLSKACTSYNHTVIKILTDRLPNKTIQTLKELFQHRNRYEVKVIHLVRDPRAVLYSMVYTVKWIKNHLDPNFRENVYKFCDPILQNVRLGIVSPLPWLKDRFRVIRYEDLVVNTVNVAQELYRFAGFDWSVSGVDNWLKQHVSQAGKAAKRDPYSLYRNPSHVIDKWKKAPEGFIRAVEDVCGELMNILGYEKWSRNDR